MEHTYAACALDKFVVENASAHRHGVAFQNHLTVHVAHESAVEIHLAYFLLSVDVEIHGGDFARFLI